MHLHHVLFITFATRRDNILPQNHISDTTSWQPWHTISAVYLCSYIHVEIYCHCAIYHCSYAIYLRYHIPSKGALSLFLSPCILIYTSWVGWGLLIGYWVPQYHARRPLYLRKRAKGAAMVIAMGSGRSWIIPWKSAE